jgi:phosphoglycolate phosphatase
LLEVVGRMGLTLPEIAYIGDSETDSETAQRAGARFGLYTEGYRKAAPEALFHNFLFNDYRHLSDRLAQLN